MEKTQLAKKIIYSAFDGKVDKGGRPYVEHCLEVHRKVARDYSNNEQAECIALLHDLLEDCPQWTEGALRNLFDDRIVDAVVLLTKKKNQSYEDYISGILTDGFAITVKLADLRHNMDLTRLTEITDKDLERVKKYHKAYFTLTPIPQ